MSEHIELIKSYARRNGGDLDPYPVDCDGMFVFFDDCDLAWEFIIELQNAARSRYGHELEVDGPEEWLEDRSDRFYVLIQL